MNPFGIGKPCIIIARRELLFEAYIMALKQEKYYIEVHNDDAINRKLIWLDFMQQKSNSMDGLYLHEESLLIYTIIENQSREKSAAEVETLNRKWITETKIRNVHQSLLQKILSCE